MNATTILCVDDEANVLKAIKRLLRREPYEVFTAESGDEALALLEKIQPEVVISDQRMPGMQGTELLQRVRQLRPDAVRVVLSGYADASSILEAINLGHIFRFLTKPWQDDQLRDAIAQCVQQYELGMQNRRLMEHVADQNLQLKRWNDTLELAVEARTRSLELAQDVLTRLPLPIMGVDVEGRVVLMNEAAASAGSPWQRVSVGDDAAAVLPIDVALAVAQCLSDGVLSDDCELAETGVLVRQLINGDNVRGCLLALAPQVVPAMWPTPALAK